MGEHANGSKEDEPIEALIGTLQRRRDRRQGGFTRTGGSGQGSRATREGSDGSGGPDEAADSSWLVEDDPPQEFDVVDAQVEHRGVYVASEVFRHEGEAPEEGDGIEVRFHPEVSGGEYRDPTIDHPPEGIDHPSEGIDHPPEGIDHPPEGVDHPREVGNKGRHHAKGTDRAQVDRREADDAEAVDDPSNTQVTAQ